jgi:hypothetical protein
MAAFGGGATVKAAEPKIMPGELKACTRTLTDEDIERIVAAVRQPQVWPTTATGMQGVMMTCAPFTPGATRMEKTGPDDVDWWIKR